MVGLELDFKQRRRHPDCKDVHAELARKAELLFV
jgi:hypothetical protein